LFYLDAEPGFLEQETVPETQVLPVVPDEIPAACVVFLAFLYVVPFAFPSIVQYAPHVYLPVLVVEE
jgi:hypothetical protein